MKLLLLGVTGGTGAALLSQAVTAGHQVTAIARRPETVRVGENPHVTVVAGDVLVPGSWQNAAAGHDALLSCLGSTDRRHPTTIYSRGTRNALGALGTSPNRRLVCLSSAGLYVAPTTPVAQKLVTRLVVQKIYRHGYDDMRPMEAALHQQDVRWTVVRPPMLADRPPTGNYRTAINSHLENPRTITRADLAHYMLNAIEDPSTVKAVVEISS